MTKVLHRKLIRDNAPNKMREAGVNFETRRLEGAEFKKELLKKVVEEATELGAAQRNDEIVAELADMLDVLDQIKKAFDIDEAVLKKARVVNAKKRATSATTFS
jgi:predicted house-cleaning noncanonical NTP pyrophosphatase (MazG superfamily)